MNLKRLVYLLIEKALAKYTDQIVCISKAERDAALREGICEDKKLSLIPNGIDIDKVISAEPISKRELGLGEDNYVIGMIGRLSRQKAPDIFIRAAELIKNSIPNSVFIIVGDGEERVATETFAREHGLELIVTGWVDNPYSYLKVFDVALLLSRWEGFGLAIAEYMAGRKPIVATRVDAIPTLVDDWVDGLLVEVDSPEETARKVKYIYEHKEDVKNMIEKAYKKVVAQYDIHRVAEQHMKLFSTLAKGDGY